MDYRTAYLTPHEHQSVTQVGGVYCPECLRQYDRRVQLLALTGYAAGVISTFARLEGQWVRWRQEPDQLWRVGLVRDWEWPNCCLRIQDADWYGGGRDRWLRFGWCGILDDHCSVQLLSRAARKHLGATV